MALKVLIVGGVAGGATAAARIRRLDETARIILFERGEFISFANCGLPYYIGDIIEDRDDLLVTTAADFADQYRVDVRTRCEVTAIHRDRHEVSVTDLNTGEPLTETYDRLILSPGAEPIRPPLPGIDLDTIFFLRNIPDADRIRRMVDRSDPPPTSAVVVGGGFIGLEMAENLVHRGVAVTVVEMLDQVMPPLDAEMAGFIHDHLRDQGVACELGVRVTGFREEAGRTVVSLDGGREIGTDLVILSAGIRPENQLAAAAGLTLGDRGGIRVDATLRTDDPDIFAVGDAAEIRDRLTGEPVMTPLAGPANKQARIAADNAVGRRSLFTGTLGTAVVKVFDLTVASTGAGEKRLRDRGTPYLVSYTYSGSHAGYYPGATTMAIKLLFAPHDGRLLGVQIVGERGVDKRIDVLATALAGRMTVFDLEALELAYAPPYGSAKDPVNIAGFVAANMIKGDMAVVHFHELAGLDPDRTVLIDLRTTPELEEEGRIEGAIHIPIDALRDRLGDLDRDRDYVLFCAVGMRGYLGYRIMAHHGFSVRNLSGGFATCVSGRRLMAGGPALIPTPKE